MNKYGKRDKLISSQKCVKGRPRQRPFFHTQRMVKNMATLGGWNIDEMKGCKLPQKVASGFTEIMGGVVGAEYEPVLYIGNQVVNGTNYCLLAVQTLVTVNAPKRLVKIVIHEALDGTFSLKTIRGVSL